MRKLKKLLAILCAVTAPGIVDADRNPVLTRSEVYSGVYGRASINLYASAATATRASPVG